MALRHLNRPNGVTFTAWPDGPYVMGPMAVTHVQWPDSQNTTKWAQ